MLINNKLPYHSCPEPFRRKVDSLWNEINDFCDLLMTRCNERERNKLERLKRSMESLLFNKKFGPERSDVDKISQEIQALSRSIDSRET